MQIFIKTLSGRSVTLENLEACDPIETVMREVETKEGVPRSLQRLVYGGKQLLEGAGRVLSDYGVRWGARGISFRGGVEPPLLPALLGRDCNRLDELLPLR